MKRTDKLMQSSVYKLFKFLLIFSLYIFAVVISGKLIELYLGIPMHDFSILQKKAFGVGLLLAFFALPILNAKISVLVDSMMKLYFDSRAAL
jgi:hypothetical protein